MFILKTKKIILIITVLIGAVILCFSGCDKNKFADQERKNLVIENGVFSVNFLRLNLGDCTIVKLPDGRVFMIDVGLGEEDYKIIKDCLTASSIDKIDYCILSNLFSINEINRFLDEFTFDTVFLPTLKNTENIEGYDQTILNLRDKSVNIEPTTVGNSVIEENYFFTFLSPITVGVDSMIKDLERGEITKSNAEYASAVVYLDYNGKTFIFGGDANKESFDKIMELDSVNFYNVITSGTNKRVNLSNVDLFKVSKHGDKNCINEDFCNKISAKFGVFSVNSINNERYPHSFAVSALIKANKNVTILRTDQKGSFSVFLDGERLKAK